MSQPSRPDTKARVFALTQQEAHATLDIVTSILTIFDCKACILIDLGFIHFFISRTFAMHVDKKMRPLDCTVVMATLLGNSLLVESLFQNYTIRVGNKYMVANLILLDIHDFDAMLQMH